MKPLVTTDPPINLWIDEVNANEHIAALQDGGEISAEEAKQLRFFRENGYLILPGVVSVSQVDEMLAAL
jgi:hypothetical protein